MSCFSIFLPPDSLLLLVCFGVRFHLDNRYASFEVRSGDNVHRFAVASIDSRWTELSERFSRNESFLASYNLLVNFAIDHTEDLLGMVVEKLIIETLLLLLQN